MARLCTRGQTLPRRRRLCNEGSPREAALATLSALCALGGTGATLAAGVGGAS